MDWSLALGIFVFGATVGGLLVFAVMSDSKPLIDQFRDLPDTPEQRARGVGL